MKPCTLILLSLIACSDSTTTTLQPDARPPAMTWRDAYAVWFDAWCYASYRCIPDGFIEAFGDHATCVERQVETYYCRGQEWWCDGLYPGERVEELRQCWEEMVVIDCWATVMPEVCWEAVR